MESIIVYPKNSMEMTALKSVLKDMNIKFEKFHTRNAKKSPQVQDKIFAKKMDKAAKPARNNPKTDL
jgi:hypothetical protein